MASQAKAAVSDFLNKGGKHDTSVHERVAPAVTHESVNKTQHENVTTAIDKEVHQDHYHTSVQPVHDREVLPESHKHNLVGVEHRTFDHGDSRDVEGKLAREAAKFKDERVVGDTKHTHSVAPTVGGEHIHHHVHETIQPVVQREVLQPSVVHTTVPIHETHHNASQHHSTSALPSVSLSDFKKQGGVLDGRGVRTDAFEGEPRSVGGALSGSANEFTSGTTGSSTTGRGVGSSTTGTGLGSSTTGTTGTGLGSSTTGHHSTTGTGLGSSTTGTGLGSSTTGTTGTGLGSSTTGHHSTTGASTGSKLDPRTDSDRDGKRGIMD